MAIIKPRKKKGTLYKKNLKIHKQMPGKKTKFKQNQRKNKINQLTAKGKQKSTITYITNKSNQPT